MGTPFGNSWGSPWEVHGDSLGKSKGVPFGTPRGFPLEIPGGSKIVFNRCEGGSPSFDRAQNAKHRSLEFFWWPQKARTGLNMVFGRIRKLINLIY